METHGETMARNPVVLGVGNPLFGDDGFGIEVVRRLRERGEIASVEILDGGTAGIYLLPELEDRDHVVLVDAVNFGGAPGEIIRLRNDEIPRALGLKLSEHQVTVKEVLALLELLDSRPGDVLLIGVQPAQLRFAEPLTGAVEAAIDRVCEMVVAEVRTWDQGGFDARDEDGGCRIARAERLDECAVSA